MRQNGREYYKTGTLKGISTRAGYIQSAKTPGYRYTIFLNSPGKSARKVVRLLMQNLE
jgi:D-alanyl-D-alanine carboxypeptidase/D-alanyl-D-alanine-endopeptidase (penicillin-binding protein 4)